MVYHMADNLDDWMVELLVVVMENGSVGSLVYLVVEMLVEWTVDSKIEM
jgi:hypothetical protein